MLNRRNLFVAAGAALGFLAAPFQKTLQSPLCGQAIGKPISAKLDSFIGFVPDHKHFLYAKFPVEHKVTVKYEKGTEEWVAYNVPMDDAASFTMKEFLTSKYEWEPIKAAGGSVIYRGSKFRLNSIVINDDVTGEEADSIYKVIA